MQNFWMIRAGEGGQLAEDFKRHGVVAFNSAAKDLSTVTSKEQLRSLVETAFPNRKPGFYPIAVGTTLTFFSEVRVGDKVVSYDPSRRVYLFGEVQGNYEYRPQLVPNNYDHVHKVKWLNEVSRDQLSPTARNRLGSAVAIFKPGLDVLAEIQQKLSVPNVAATNGGASNAENSDSAVSDVERIGREIEEKGHEFIKDKIVGLDWEEMQELVAAILRAMGFKTTVSRAGPDRGKDIVASQDGLGLSGHRIKVQVKHRPDSQMDAAEIRSFLGVLQGDDRGLYVSTGGFSREAHYQADSSPKPIQLIDLDSLAELLVQNYEKMDNDGRALLPLTRFYWPATG